MIDGDDGNSYVFQTPDNNNGKVLTCPGRITFTVVNGRHIDSVTQDVEAPPGGGKA